MIASTLGRLREALGETAEIIVSDGGSTDGTQAIARPLADRVIEHLERERQTIAAGRNAGARAARGSLLVFLDADCVVDHPVEFFRRALAQFSARPELAGLTGQLRVWPEEETGVDRAILFLMNLITRWKNNVLKKGDSAGGEFQMVRREAFEKIGGYREDLVTCEDRDLFRRLTTVGATFSDPRLVVFHSGRRAHNMGWPRLILIFLANTISFRLRGKSFSQEWKPTR